MKQNNKASAMKIIGVTGGVGSGKSSVLEELQNSYNAVICQADDVARCLQKKGQQCYDTIVQKFGNAVLGQDGEIDRQKLSGVVFASPKKLQELNAIVHPAVKEEIISQIQREKEHRTTLFIIEAALLLEDHYDAICDELWYIYTDEDVRRTRLKESRGYSDEKIDSIMRNQMAEKEFFQRCDRVIHNSRDFDSTCQQIRQIMKEMQKTGETPSIQ